MKWWLAWLPLVVCACDAAQPECKTVAECCARYGSCGVDGAAGLGAGDLGVGAHAQAGVCATYVSCATAAEPSQAAAILAAYGPSGTCWQSTAEVAATCQTACQKGIEGLHSVEPQMCPLCQSSADCSGDTPACDTAQGQCVECVTNDACPPAFPVCKNQKCVEGCLSNQECPSSAPACDTTSNQCYECISNADCASSMRGKSCDSFTHSCGCGAFGGCGANQVCSGGVCCTPDCSGRECGAPSGCGANLTDYCGTCPGGACDQFNVCYSNNKVCTPGPGACFDTEACLYDTQSKGYRCATDAVHVVDGSCMVSSDCDFLASDLRASQFICRSGKCEPYCFAGGDCKSGTCNPLVNPISPTNPGICVAP